MIVVLPLLTGGVIFYLCRTGRLARKLGILLLIGTAAGALLLLRDSRNGPKQTVTELERNAAGRANEPVPLEVEMDDGTVEQVTIRIPEKGRTAAEIRQALDETAAGLEGQILGENPSLSEVCRDLKLPTSFADPDITVIWSSDRPDILNGQGVIGPGAEAAGSPVRLKAALTLEDQTVVFQRDLTVYPSREEGAVARRLQEEGDALNEGRADAAYRLPEELDGRRLTWYRENENAGRDLCLLLLLAAVLASVSARQREEDRRRKRQESLLRSYPELLSRIQLLLAAGLGLRRALERLAADSRREKKRNGRTGPCGEEVLRMWYELENGVPEQEALMHFGERTGLPEYKGFALLLAQNQKKGGHRLPQLLETEVQAAFEDRKRQARVAGEKAAVRLALPMGMMLLVVLVIVMVPAVMSF